MSDARAWLNRQSTSADINAGMPSHRMQQALLAVLDECDMFDEEPGLDETVWENALRHTSDRIRAAIDKALGVTDD